MDTLSFSGNQIAYLGLRHAALETYLVESGYWGNDTLRQRHGYVLSPCVYTASKKQQSDLERLAKTTYAAVRALNNELCRIGTGRDHLSHDEALLLRLANNASRGLLRPKDGETRIPPVIKVDLVQDMFGNYSIVEVDTYNPRGFGYVALLEESLPPGLRRFPGVQGLVNIFKDYGVSAEEPWHILVSEFERYYETPFRIFERTMSARGVPLLLTREAECARRPHARLGVGGGVLVIPDSLDTHPSVRTELLESYQRGELRTFYPPVAYLGSKAFLPFLRSCDGMEEFIPPTVLVHKKCGKIDDRIDFGTPLVLKATVSSGLKKVFFDDLDGETYSYAFDHALSLKRPSWILQQQVSQETTQVLVFDEAGELSVQNYFFRITAYISENGIVDAEITGRPDRKVHGAPDCIQLPVVLS